MEKTLLLIALAVKSHEIRGRRVDNGEIVVLRPEASSCDGTETEGEIITVAVAKEWKKARECYLSGKILEHRLDCDRLGVKPLVIERFGDWIPEERMTGEVDERVRNLAGKETSKIFARMIRLNPRDNQGVRAHLAAIEDGFVPKWEEELDDDDERFGLNIEGECQACDEILPLNDLMLCDECAGKPALTPAAPCGAAGQGWIAI